MKVKYHKIEIEAIDCNTLTETQNDYANSIKGQILGAILAHGGLLGNEKYSQKITELCNDPDSLTWINRRGINYRDLLRQ